MGNVDVIFKNFVSESEEMMRDLSKMLTDLESSPRDTSIVDNIFRIVHTLKGNSAIFGLKGIKAVSHSLEDMLSVLRENKVVPGDECIKTLWKAIKLLSDGIDVLKENKPVGDISKEEQELVDRIAKKEWLVQVSTKESADNVRATDKVRYMAGNTDISRPVFIVQAFINNTLNGSFGGGTVTSFQESLSKIASILKDAGKSEGASGAMKMLSDYEALADDSGRPDEFLAKMLQEGFIDLLHNIERVDLSDDKDHLPEADVKGKTSFRIEEEKIDELMAELKKVESHKDALSLTRDRMIEDGVSSETVMSLQKAINDLNFTYRDIRNMLIRIKTTSPGLLFGKTERMIMALAEKGGKKVVVKTTGSDLVIDRSYAEVLDSVLLHIARNSIDHGIEPPEERIEAGKPEYGTIEVEAVQESDNVRIGISDDGRGVDLNELKEAALNSGIISSEKKDNMSQSEVEELIFVPGVTTSKKVTDLSGRGIGLDAVKKKLEGVKGKIKVEAGPGKGTRFTIIFPGKILK